MLRRPFATTLVATLAALLLTPSAAHAAQDGVPVPVPLTANWQKLADPGIVGVGEGFWKPDSKAAWKPAVVPSVFTGQTPARAYEGEVGWYRVTFDAPAATEGFEYDIRFEQVRRYARIWLNGVPIGRSDDAYVPFDLRPGGALKYGERNVLVVRADSRKVGNIREGWWNWGGITRPVTLVPRGSLELHDAGVMSDVDCPDGGGTCAAKVLLDAVLVNRGRTTIQTPKVRLALGGQGTDLATVADARALAPGEQTRVRAALPVPDPQLWSPASPALYDVTLTTTAGDAVQQIDRRRTGLREVRVKDGMLRLNGRQLALRGAAIQEDVPGRGPALRDADIAQIVRELKEVNANVTRAHYLLNPKLLEALDAAGIMVWSQAPIYHRDQLLRTPEQREVALNTVRDTILSARNHPSVITHSVANELSPVPDTVPGTRAFLGAARALARQLDPTIPASVDLLSYPGYPRQRSYGQYELLGINSYFGWYKGKKSRSVAKLEDLGPFLDRMRAMYPQQALQVTEFGAESTFSGPETVKETYAFQTQYLAKVLKILEERPFIGGAIYWTLREFAVKPNWVGGVERPVARDSIHNKGLITYAGKKKPAWLVAARNFADTPLYRTVSPAAAAGVPGANRSGGGSGATFALMLGFLVVGLLALDGWAILGILRGSRVRGRDGGNSGEPAGARAV